MVGTAGEVVLVNRAVIQPSPCIFPHGDCGACVLAGALGISVERVYGELKGEIQSVTHGEMARMLRVAESMGLADRSIQYAADWNYLAANAGASFGRPARNLYIQWFTYVRMAIDAGYYGLAQVTCHPNPVNMNPETDHWVLICGARTEGSVVGKVITGEVLVSCSALSTPGLTWVEAREFLTHRGGFDLLFVRPAGNR